MKWTNHREIGMKEYFKLFSSLMKFMKNLEDSKKVRKARRKYLEKTSSK